MDVREKLAELIRKGARGHTFMPTETIANYLVENGVTVQEWISVKDRLPKIYDKDSDWSGTVLFRTTQGHIHSGRRKFGRHRMSFWIDESDNLFFSKEEVTHWMPLPQPPKGE